MSGSRAAEVFAAWERFAAGDDDVRGVSLTVLGSWYRSRDVYLIDPTLLGAPRARSGPPAPLLRCEEAFAQLGGIAAVIAARAPDSLASVSDGTGRIVAWWGSGRSRRRAEDLWSGPGMAWPEPTAGTNGLGTALRHGGPLSIRGPEHWCAALHAWQCTSIAIRDPVTGEPVAALTVSRWCRESPASTRVLQRETQPVRQVLRLRAREDTGRVHQAFRDADRRARNPLLAVDMAGRVIAANRAAQDLPEVLPTARRRALRVVAARTRHGRAAAPGSIDLGQLDDGPTRRFDVHPVCSSVAVIGLLLVGTHDPSGPDDAITADGPDEDPGRDAGPGDGQPQRRTRVPAERAGRVVLLAPEEIRYAEASGHDVWLVTDQGRLRACTRGIERIGEELEPCGFMRVHRSYLVNLRRICEVDRPGKGVVTVTTLSSRHERIPVSRRCSAQLRAVLGV